MDEPGAVQYANKKVEKKTEQLDTQKPENELIKNVSKESSGLEKPE